MSINSTSHLEDIKQVRPDLYSLYQENKDKSFHDYLLWLNDSEIDKEFFSTRKSDFINHIRSQLGETFNIDISAIIRELEKIQQNTTNHFWIMQNDEIINNTVLDILRNHDSKTQVSFPWWKVPINNVTKPFILQSSWENFDIFKYFNQNLTKNHIVLLLDSFNLKKDDILESLKSSKAEINEEIINIFTKYNHSPDFITQCSRINKDLYSLIFHPQKDIIFLEKYSLIQSYLCELLQKDSNMISHIFRDDKLLSNLCGKYWTDLFRLNRDLKLKNLHYNNWDLFYKQEKLLNIQDDINKLIRLSQQKKLIISLELMFCILSFYLWYECLWWIFQVNYLPKIQKSRESIVKEISENEEDKVKGISSNKLIWNFNIVWNKWLIDYINQDQKIEMDDVKKESEWKAFTDFFDSKKIAEILCPKK